MTTAPDLLVSVDWLAANRDEVIVVDVRPADRYDAGHIPGARHIDLYPIKILDSDPDLIAGWAEAIEAAFQQLGICAGDRVVFYEDYSGTTAARGVWVMHALALGEGSLLDGGLTAWQEAGHEVDTAPVEVAPSDLRAQFDASHFATADDVLGAADGNGVIVDTRGAIEWMQGTIPTARHLEWVQHLRPDGTLKPMEELRALYREHGIMPEDKVITFCASGYRAAHTWLVLALLGYGNVRNYAPSWGEWGRRTDLPVAATR